jgi:hypothetical protein
MRDDALFDQLGCAISSSGAERLERTAEMVEDVACELAAEESAETCPHLKRLDIAAVRWFMACRTGIPDDVCERLTAAAAAWEDALSKLEATRRDVECIPPAKPLPAKSHRKTR